MANKFLGEAGLGVLVDEIKKKSVSENKSILDTLFEDAQWLTNLDQNSELIIDDSNAINYYTAISSYQILMALYMNIFDEEIPSSIENYCDIIEHINARFNESIDAKYPSSSYYKFLQNNNICLYVIIQLFQLVRVDNGTRKLQYRNDMGDLTWHDYNPVSEISADEVTNKFA